MNENEKQILESIAESFHKMSDFQKGYFLGVADGMAEKHRQEMKETQTA